MSKKHYIEFARVYAADLAIHRDNPEIRRALRNNILSMTDVFKRDNPRFDRARFLTACGLTAEDAPMSFAGVS